MQDVIIENENKKNIRNHAQYALQSGICEVDVIKAEQNLAQTKNKENTESLSR